VRQEAEVWHTYACTQVPLEGRDTQEGKVEVLFVVLTYKEHLN